MFDDEGTISTNLAISMANYDLITQLRELVSHMGILVSNISVKKDKLNRDNYYFSIKSKSFKMFKDKIGFFHPKKKANLDVALKIRQRKQRTRPVEVIDQEIIKILIEKQMKTIELANELQFTLGHRLSHLKRLERGNLIKRSGYKNSIVWSLA